jgi:hypothetical protein
MDFDSFKHFEPSEQLVTVLKNKNQSKEELFFRVMVAYYFTKVSSIMRTSIKTLDRGKIPTNMYALNLATSGFGKGRSINIIENEILDGFKNVFMDSTLPKIADKNLAKIAIARAAKTGTDPDDMYQKVLTEYANTGAYLFNFDSGTAPAVKQLRHQLLLAGAGSINLEMDEVGANFSNNLEVLNTFIELYDVGKVKPKITKSTKENVRNEDIAGATPANLLLFGTPSKLLDGGRVEKEFYDMLDMGYARRLLFSYVERTEATTGMSPEDLFDLMTDTSTDLFIKSLHDELQDLADEKHFGKELYIDKTTSIELIKYQQYCQERAQNMKEHQEMEKAEMTHRYFKTLKLAGAYAFIDKSADITMDHLHAAMKLVEESGKAFERILRRDKPYVKLAKYIADVEKEVTHVDLVEDLPFYKGSEGQKRELLNLAIAYGYKNNIIIKKSYIDGIEFLKGESLPETNLQELRVSASNDIAVGYGHDIVTFDQLKDFVIMPDLHFTAHHWKNGERNKANLIPGFNLVILDIDSGIKLDIAKDLLSDYQYIIYTTKRHQIDGHGDRFRIILPMSHLISLGSDEYSKFMENVFNWVPFDVDEATKDIARKWATNPGEVYVNEGKLLDAMQFIPQTKKSEEMTLQRQQVSSMSNLQAWFFRKIGEGNRNNILLKYGLVLVDNGYDIDSVRNAVVDFNSKITDPLPEEEIHRTLMITITKRMAEMGRL